MKCLIAFATLALFACINANPYGSLGGGYGGRGHGQLAYVEERGYGGYGGIRRNEGIRGYGENLRHGGYGGIRGGEYEDLVIAESSRPRSIARAASAASASAGESGLNRGRYEKLGVIGYNLDSSYNGHRGGY